MQVHPYEIDDIPVNDIVLTSLEKNRSLEILNVYCILQHIEYLLIIQTLVTCCAKCLSLDF